MEHDGKSRVAESAAEMRIHRWKADCEVYKSERDSLSDAEQECEQSYDKWLLTLSGGALGLSMTFIKEIAHPPITGAWSVFVAWVLFGLSIVSILANLRIGPHAHARFRAILDDEFAPDRYSADRDVWKSIRERQAGVKLLRAMDVLNWSSLSCFFVGVILLAIFVIRNMH
jgi:hypothetical protein